MDGNGNRDIKIFVEEEVEDKIWATGRTDVRDLADEIKLKLVSGAQGMYEFLSTKLILRAKGRFLCLKYKHCVQIAIPIQCFAKL